MNNKHFHDTPLPWGEGGCKGERGNTGKGEIFVVVYFTFPFILRPLTINTNHKPTFEVMKLRTGVAPPPLFVDMSVKSFFLHLL